MLAREAVISLPIPQAAHLERLARHDPRGVQGSGVYEERTDRIAAINRTLDEGEGIATLGPNGPPK